MLDVSPRKVQMNSNNLSNTKANHSAHQHPLAISRLSAILFGILVPLLLLGAAAGSLGQSGSEAMLRYPKTALLLGAAFLMHAKWFLGYLPHPKISRIGMDIGILIMVLGAVSLAYRYLTH